MDAEGVSVDLGLGCGDRGRWQGEVELVVEANRAGAHGGSAIAGEAMRCFPERHLAVECSDGHFADNVVWLVLVGVVDDFSLGFEGEDGSSGGLAVGF